MRTINSPGIQVNEIDLSNYALGPVGTTVFAAGFANQGPVDEVLNVTTISEFENVYGFPTTTAEAYFYESCKQVLQSPGRLYCTRLPYGSGSGDGFSQHYSALLYPATKTQETFIYATSATSVQSIRILNDEGIEGVDFEHGIDSLTLTPIEKRVGAMGEDTSFTLESTRKVGDTTILSVSTVKVTYRSVVGGEVIALGAPRQVSLTLDEYQMIANQEFDWDDLRDGPPNDPQWLTYKAEGGIDYNLMQNVGAIVLNTRQTTNDENGIGYYINFADNTQWGPENTYESILGAKGLTSNNTIVRTEDEVDTYPGEDENLVTIPSNRFTRKLNSENGADSVSRDIENIPKYDFGAAYYDDSVVVTVVKVDHSNYQPNLLTPTVVEAFVGSFDSNKKSIADSGGVKKSFFLQDTVNQSSSRIKLFINPAISKGVQWVDTSSPSPNPTVKTRVQPVAQYLFGNGVYRTSFANETNAKDVGDVASKLEHALRLVENTDTYTIDILIDGGLSTVHTNKDLTGSYDDTKRLASDKTNLSTEDAAPALAWRRVYNVLNATASTLRRDCIAIVDPLRQVFLSGNAKQSERRNISFTEAVYKPLKNLLAAADSNYVAVYGNWGLSYNPSIDRNIWLPMSGAVAATYAKSDAVSQPWFAPAGFTRGQLQGFVDLACNPTQKQRDNLYTISVNPVVFFSGEGFVIYGQKTCQKKPTAFDRVNVRRLFLTLERTTARACKYFVFEPNNAMTRTRLLTTISPIFDNAKRTQGLYDFMIVCDDRNNPSDAIDRNELIVDIYIKPVKAAEFILINFIATRTGQDFSEIA